MDNDPKDRGGGAILIAAAAMALCCAVPVLLFTGGLGVALAWLSGGGIGWLLLAAFVGLTVGGLFLRRRRVAAEREGSREPGPAADIPDRVRDAEKRTTREPAASESTLPRR